MHSFLTASRNISILRLFPERTRFILLPLDLQSSSHITADMSLKSSLLSTALLASTALAGFSTTVWDQNGANPPTAPIVKFETTIQVPMHLHQQGAMIPTVITDSRSQRTRPSPLARHVGDGYVPDPDPHHERPGVPDVRT